MYNNSIEILKMANGWMVTLPTPAPCIQQAPRFDYKEMLNDMIPTLRQITGKLHEDPILAKIREDNEALEKRTPEVQEVPVIGKNEYVFLFADFQGVLNFLAQKFLHA